MSKPQQLFTRLAQAGTRSDPTTGSLSTPIYQVASFRHPALGQSTGFDYSRTSNPTRLTLEQTLADIDSGHQAFAFASGMAAIDATLRTLKPGARVVVTEDLYGGTFRLFESLLRPLGISAYYIDTSDTPAVAELCKTIKPQALFVESPTNPILKVADLRALASICRSHSILLIVDNTFMTPLLQRPIEQGADLVVYSATKYLAGHNDVVAGSIVTANPELSEKIAFIQNATGAILGPQDSWLTLRGLKTLHLRLERQQSNATTIATWLQQHPRVRLVHYPGLSNHPGHHLITREQSGGGGMVSFEVTSRDSIPRILAGVRLFLFAESLGGVESLITYPTQQTHADIDQATRERLGINDSLLRLSLGVEDVNDLIADLDRVL